MVKLFFLCRRRPDLSHVEYVHRLLDGHVPLALRHHPTMRRYVVNVVEGARGPAPELDSIGVLWFDTLADFYERLYDSPEGRRIIGEDVARFMGSAVAYATEEHVQRAPAAPAIGVATPGAKLVAAVGRHTGQSHEAFTQHWLERHVPLALAHHPTTRYVTNVVQARLDGDGPDYDGFAELAFRSVEDMTTGMYRTPEGRTAIEADMARFLGTVHAWTVIEYVQRW